ncbi:twitching motility protein PilT [candidate division KSB1 bacterium 4484_188]|nr:MAG: twitching motility protein PilT [candidate division KSB1 bacterium 4484_188]HFE63605.1 PIN domain-containing protein [Caldithrix sp.]
MSVKIFLDTNLLVYSMDQNDPRKKEQSREVLRTIRDEYRGVISTQVMQEFYVAATRKLGVDPLLAKNIIQQFENFEVVIISPEIIYEAIDCSMISQLSFWDALIIVSAERAKCREIWTEDLNHGQIIRGVKVVNPLS